MTTTCPTPPSPMPSWDLFVTLIWGWGRRNVTDDLMRPWLDRAHGEMTRAHEPGPAIRPSGNLHCAMKTYLRTRGVEEEPTPSWLAATFNVGHLLHNMSYGYIESALPDCFEAEYETPIDLTAIPWWPGGDLARQEGTADMVIRVKEGAEAEASRYLDLRAARPQVLVDFKTMSQWSYAKHAKGFIEDHPDTFGYLSQLPVYREVLGAQKTDCVLSGINRNNLREGKGGAPLASVLVGRSFLDDEAERVKRRLTEPEPRPEFLDIWGAKADFSCDVKKGTCGDRVRCSEFRSGLEV